jgi:hypothetical protein
VSFGLFGILPAWKAASLAEHGAFDRDIKGNTGGQMMLRFRIARQTISS